MVEVLLNRAKKEGERDMPIEVNIICEECGKYANKTTYVNLAVKDNRVFEGAMPLNTLSTFDVVFCSLGCTKEYLRKIT